MTRSNVVAASSLLLVGLTSPVSGDNWPGWRGDGSGVSHETELPEAWGPDSNILWKTRIEGSGISAPIVWGNRVFVTTAIEGSEASVSRWAVASLCSALLLLSIVAVVLGRRSPRDQRGLPVSSVLRVVGWLDRLAFLGGGLLFASVVTVLFYTEKRGYISGDVAAAWRVSGLIGVAGLVGVVGWFEMRSGWRLLGSCLLLTAAVLFYLFQPLNMSTEPMPLKKILSVCGPLSIAGAWHVLVFLVSRRGLRAQTPPVLRRASIWGAIGPTALFAATALQFAYINYLQPKVGLIRSVVCLDRDTGTVSWRRPALLAPAERKYYLNSYATPTPVTDGEYIVASFGHGIVGMDFDGHVLWRRLEPKYTQFLRYGSASSPVMNQHRVIHTFMAEWPGGGAPRDSDYAYQEHSYLIAMDKKTGETLWRIRPAGSHDSYGTPFLAGEEDTATLLLSTWEHVIAYDPQDGKQRWSCRIPIQQGVPSVVVDATAAYVIGGTHGPKAAVAIRRGGRGDITDTHKLWTLKKTIPQNSSPILYAGLLYWVTDFGIAVCVNPQSGDVVWKKRIGGHYLASPVAGDGKVYFVAEDGTVVVIQAGNIYKELARNHLGEAGCIATPAISDGKIFIRSEQTLFCIAHPGE